MPKLVVLSEEMAGKEFALIGDKLQVGRGPANDVRIEDGSISGTHAELVLQGSDYLLRDLNSTNGTRVNGEQITEFKLTGGEQVRFGRIDCRYEGEGKKSSKPLPPVKKGVPLDAGGTRRTTVFQNVSPFKKKSDKSTRVLQISIIALAVVALVMFGIVLIKFLQKP